MSKRAIDPILSRYLQAEISCNDPRRQKVALQEVSRLYRSGFIFNEIDRKAVEEKLNSQLLKIGIDRKVLRWSLNSLALLGRYESSIRFVNGVVAEYDEVEIVGAAVSAAYKLSNFGQKDLGKSADVESKVRYLSALQYADPNTISEDRCIIDIENDDPEIIKLGLIVVGLGNGHENLFHPSHTNADLIKSLSSHHDVIVQQYCLWAAIENNEVGRDGVYYKIDDLDRLTPNVQSKLLQALVNFEENGGKRRELIEIGGARDEVDAREGTAKGLLHRYSPEIERVVLDWVEREDSRTVLEHLALHVSANSEHSSEYFELSKLLYQIRPELADRLKVGARGKDLYLHLVDIEGKNGHEGDLFDGAGAPLLGQRAFSARGIDTANNKRDVLAIFGSPIEIGESKLRFDVERREIRRGQEEVNNIESTLKINPYENVVPDELVKILQSSQADFIHFSGHGDGEFISFEDYYGKPQEVRYSELSSILLRNAGGVECIVCNICDSAELAKLLGSQLDYAVGYEGTLDDAIAAAFSRAFYRSLAQGRNVVAAFMDAKDQITLNFSPDGFDDAERYKIFGRKFGS